MKKIVVPERMLKAALGVESPEFACISEVIVKNALLWLSENPVVPTDEQAVDVELSVGGESHRERRILFAAEWQRRMFLAAEEEIPEAVKDLIYANPKDAFSVGRIGVLDHNKSVFEAYRRGRDHGLCPHGQAYYTCPKCKPNWDAR